MLLLMFFFLLSTRSQQCFGGSDLVHLVDSDGQLSDTEWTHQQGVLSGLTAGLEARLKLPSAGVNHQHGYVGLVGVSGKMEEIRNTSAFIITTSIFIVIMY